MEENSGRHLTARKNLGQLKESWNRSRSVSGEWLF